MFIRIFGFFFVAALVSATESVSVQVTEQQKAIPNILYGGAWKGPHAEQNVLDAVSLGFRSFDTANVFPASYNETAMGAALEKAMSSGLVRREDLFIQTKFTPGISDKYCDAGPWNPETCMFDKAADLGTQVKQSVQTSLKHLRVSQLDSLVLHEMRIPWENVQVIWRAMEEVFLEGRAVRIGVSHAHYPETFRQLLAFAKVKPSFVQNPAFAYNQWDYEIRSICREHGIIYQAYSLNHEENDFVYQTKEVKAIADRLERTPQQVVVAFIKRLGLIPLVGPQDKIHMAHAITAARYLPDELTEAEVQIIENIAFSKNAKSIEKMSGKKLGLTATNALNNDVYMAWQTPDHSELRVKNGMHMPPVRIAAGETRSISAAHRHGFYIWDVKGGKKAPLYRDHSSKKRWVRRVSANSFQHGSSLDIIIDASFQVVVVNMGSEDRELMLFMGRFSQRAFVRARGGSVKLTMLDGHSIEIKDSVGGAAGSTVTLRRTDGDPQLLPLHSTEVMGTNSTSSNNVQNRGSSSSDDEL